jgi:hypothetical protein
VRVLVCKRCGRLILMRPSDTSHPKVCGSCRVRRCEQCKREFVREYRSDGSKDAGRFCCKGCYWVWRREQ